MDTYMWWWIAGSWLVGALMIGALWGAMAHIGRGDGYRGEDDELDRELEALDPRDLWRDKS